MPHLRAFVTCTFQRGHRWVYSRSHSGKVKCLRCNLRIHASGVA